MKDISEEKNIKSLCKFVNINGDLALNLIELVTDDNNSDKFNAAYAICKKYCSNSRKVSSLVALFKNDLAMIDYLSRNLKLDPDLMAVILACGCNRLELINKNYKLISDKLLIDNVHAVEFILKICSSDIDQVWKFYDEKNELFLIKNPYLL